MRSPLLFWVTMWPKSSTSYPVPPSDLSFGHVGVEATHEYKSAAVLEFVRHALNTWPKRRKREMFAFELHPFGRIGRQFLRRGAQLFALPRTNDLNPVIGPLKVRADPSHAGLDGRSSDFIHWTGRPLTMG